jgi:hypothetical protein
LIDAGSLLLMSERGGTDSHQRISAGVRNLTLIFGAAIAMPARCRADPDRIHKT